jgi:hypothetical protein
VRAREDAAALSGLVGKAVMLTTTYGPLVG